MTVSFDTNLRANMWSPSEAREALDEVVPYLDVLFISYPDETAALLGVDSPEEAIDFFQQRGVGTVAVTSGPDGALVAAPDGVLKAAAIAPNGVSDTTGRGRLRGRLPPLPRAGMGTEQGLRWGTASAGLKVAGRGGIASQPSREEVERFVDTVQVTRA